MSVPPVIAMSPVALAIIAGAAARAHAYWARRPAVNIASQRSSGWRQNGSVKPSVPASQPPHALAAGRSSRPPCSAATRAKSASVCASSVWSATAGMPRPPRAVTSSAVSSTAVCAFARACARVDRPVTYTVAPQSPSASATPRPTPRLAPVTTATRPRRSGAAQLKGRSAMERGLLLRRRERPRRLRPALLAEGEAQLARRPQTVGMVGPEGRARLLEVERAQEVASEVALLARHLLRGSANLRHLLHRPPRRHPRSRNGGIQPDRDEGLQRRFPQMPEISRERPFFPAKTPFRTAS